MHTDYNVPLAPLTTLGVGGPAARVIEATTEGEVVEIVSDVSAHGEPLLVLGGGSNLLVPDEGWPGTVLRVAIVGVVVTRADGRVRLKVGAGEEWDRVVERCADEGWSGVECLAGIPGHAGSTPIQNVGAYGREVGDVLVSVTAFDREGGAFVVLTREACDLSYRSSMFKRSHGRYVVTSIELELGLDGQSAPVRYAELARALELEPGGTAPVRRVRDTVVALRRSKGMVYDASEPESRCAGSWFTNPVLDEAQWVELQGRLHSMPELPGPPPVFPAGEGKRKVAAAWLIERAGFAKGYTRDGAGISKKHALALVNRGATARALLALEAEIVEGVRSKFGVTLAREPVLAVP